MQKVKTIWVKQFGDGGEFGILGQDFLEKFFWGSFFFVFSSLVWKVSKVTAFSAFSTAFCLLIPMFLFWEGFCKFYFVVDLNWPFYLVLAFFRQMTKKRCFPGRTKYPKTCTEKYLISRPNPISIIIKDRRSSDQENLHHCFYGET